MSKKDKNEILLPIAEIKRDLIKNVLFMVLMVVLFLVLAKTGFGYAYIARFVNL